MFSFSIGESLSNKSGKILVILVRFKTRFKPTLIRLCNDSFWAYVKSGDIDVLCNPKADEMPKVCLGASMQTKVMVSIERNSLA